MEGFECVMGGKACNACLRSIPGIKSWASNPVLLLFYQVTAKNFSEQRGKAAGQTILSACPRHLNIHVDH